ncbi:group 1 glycosyl transferase [Leptolyngbya sp. Heron Island J]|uniref:glycosyltransferase family 4 protein n=1 Tax=Leptolyngbya sp. Heron Island J TaxID=1385935 RepID=UPI0003B97CEA|nr:glycosyltransferase family 4 protein [Leptolyngbya sp. Heron Island J]ESA35871.1 group 1 glycosyl transferase [Leptolyngbya sp. Heron Island J]
MKRSTLEHQISNSTMSRQSDSRVAPIRVMHVIDKLSVSGSGVHGITKAIEWWIPRFNQQEFQFTVCSLRSPEPAGEILNQQGIPTVFLNKGKFSLTTLTSLLSLIRHEKPHILHLHGYGAANFGRLASLLTGIPNIVHEHAVLPNQPFYQTLADTLLSPLTTRALAVSEAVREFMIHERKVQPTKLETLVIGLPLAACQAPHSEELREKRADLGIADDEQIVCTVGRLDTQKGQIYLLKAAALILRELPKTRFLIVGEGPDRSMLQSVAQEEGIAEQVVFTGFRNDVPALLTMSDIVAMPSLWEGLPLTLLEAMNLHKPVVGTYAQGIGEVIQDQETGFLVPIKNVDFLAARIIYLLKNPHLARTMGEQGWKRCQDYDIMHSVQRLSDMYRTLSAHHH